MGGTLLCIDRELIKQAKLSGQIFHRSTAQQLEHWALLGRAIEKVLTVSTVRKIKRQSRPIDLEHSLAVARSGTGKRKTLALLARKKGPLYGTEPSRPGVLLRYNSEGIAVAGKMIKSKFVPRKRAGKSDAGK